MAESLREVKTRITSTKKTSQITNAMYMVSSSKVRRSQKTFNQYQDFMKNIGDIVVTVLDKAREDFEHPLLKKREAQRTAYLLITSDTGLAGAYNANVFKYFESLQETGDYVVGAIGRKGFHYIKSHNLNMMNDEAILIRDDVMYVDIVPLAKKFVDAYIKGEIDKLVIIYNHFVNSITQETVAKELLPIEKIEGEVISREYLYEGGIEKTLNDLLPMYIQAVIYGIILDAKTAEHSSRMNSMKNATDNAEEVIEKLQIRYNRARQGAITTELTDIIAGANAVE